MGCYSDATMMTDNKDVVTPFSIEQINDDDKMIRFYTGFPSFLLLMICFKFLGAAVSNLSYGDHLKLAKGKPNKLSALNDFFLMLSLVTWFTQAGFGTEISNLTIQCFSDLPLG